MSKVTHKFSKGSIEVFKRFYGDRDRAGLMRAARKDHLSCSYCLIEHHYENIPEHRKPWAKANMDWLLTEMVV